MLALLLLSLVPLALAASPEPNSSMPPSEGPLAVSVSLHVLHAKWYRNQLKLRLFLRQSWTDTRMEAGLEETRQGLPSFWSPDLFSPAATKWQCAGNAATFINNGGQVKTSQLVDVKVPCNLCPFSLAKGEGFTKCNLTLESYAYTAAKISLDWSGFTVGKEAQAQLNKTETSKSESKVGDVSYGRLTAELKVQTWITKEILWHVFDKALDY